MDWKFQKLCGKRHKKKSNNIAELYLYNVDEIPFSNNFFDRILAVNSIYFWSNPKKLIEQ